MITLLHIYGPIAIQTYGTMIALGILTGLFLIKRDKPLLSVISLDKILNLTSLVIASGVIGARALYLAEHGASSLLEVIAVWDGGLSVFGATLVNLIVIPAYLYRNNIPIMFVLDRIAIYVPLVHAIARLGCFFAGCCYGKPATNWLSYTYTNPDSLAPLNTPLIPTQLLSALGLCIIFTVLYALKNHKCNGSGYLFGSFLWATGFLRLLIDTHRAGHNPIFLMFSHNQLIAYCIMTVGMIIRNKAFRKKKTNEKTVTSSNLS
ncbi:MAG: phosphatidylglycerol:prolipoprotein diacylglycerol transferase [Alteromonas naphthalenivorans]|jgi:phosphatidylglycerol:prolipoprotein diacylglycerol transferase